MPEPQRPTSPTTDDLPQEYELPPGDHALEVAARRGLGPLSPLGRTVWHGEARPCVSCGQLVHREEPECEQCGQDLSDEMLERMLAFAGPWYVLEHVRPFPGVTLERIIRQIRRGVIGETSIVRGPETGHQWRFAGETPGLCRYFNRCWQCGDGVEPNDTHCPSCLNDLRFRYDQVGTMPAPQPPPPPRNDALARATGLVHPPQAQAAPAAEQPAELRELTMALREVAPQSTHFEVEQPRIAGLSPFWVLGAILIGAIGLLLWISKLRERTNSPQPQPPVPARTIAPASAPPAQPVRSAPSTPSDPRP